VARAPGVVIVTVNLSEVVIAKPLRMRPRVTPPKLTSPAMQRFRALITMRDADRPLRGRTLEITTSRRPPADMQGE
jgi:hypothetical protein